MDGIGSIETKGFSHEWSSLERTAALPPTGRTVSEWAESRRVLLSRTSAEPGPWRTERAPYLKAIMDAFNLPEIQEISFCKAVQVGGTEAMYNMMGYAIEEAPAPMMMVLPTVEIGKYVNRNRFAPMVDAIPELVSRKSTAVDEFNLLEMNFAGMVLNIAGANSAASLATRPVRYLFFDEVDKYPAFAGREGEPIGLATERTRTFWNRKIVKVSTPTTAKGNIWKAHQASALRYEYYVPCPHCGEYQTLTFWDKEFENYHIAWADIEGEAGLEVVYDSSYYICQRCGGHISDNHKNVMLGRGEWRDQYGEPFDYETGHARTVSFHLNTLYSPWVTFGEMAHKFLVSKDNPEEYMNFVNLWLGLPVKETVEEKISDDIAYLKADYQPGVVPAEALTLIATVDVQKMYLQFVIRAWSATESWLIREQQVLTFDELKDAIIDGAYPVAGSDLKMGVRLALIDAGYRTDEVYDFVRAYPSICRATKGASHSLRAPYTGTKIDRYPDGRVMQEGVMLWLFDTIYWKDAFVRRVGLAEGGSEAIAQWHVYPQVTQQYVYQLTAEEKIVVRNRSTGRTSELWQLKQGRKRNEVFDLEVMNLMGSEMLGIKFFTGKQKPRVATEAPQKKQVARSRWMQRGNR